MNNNMSNVDLKDRKILYHLDLNSRQSLSQLGKRVGLPKNVIAYRIKGLTERGIIKNFFTVINPFKLGYTSFGFYLVLQYATSEIKKEMFDYFIKNKNSWFVASIDGQFDMGIGFWVKDLNEFYKVWEDTLNHYRYHIEEHKIINFVQTHGYRHTYLLDEYEENERKEFIFTGSGRQINIDDIDFKLLRILSSNARIPSIEIAKKMNTTATTIRYRIKKLEEMKIIQGYRITMDINQLGYKDFRIDIDLKDYKKRKSIISYITKNPHLTYIFTSIGHSDLQLNIRVKHLDDVHNIMADLNTKFPDLIRDYRYLHFPIVYKQNYMPQG